MSGTWQNWSGTVRCTPRSRVEPASEAEVAAWVTRAADDGLPLRVAGSGHSHTGLVATPGVVVSLDRLSGILAVDRDRGEARIAAGSVLATLGEPLREHGLAMQNLGDVDVQTLAGALATGTHGTGRSLGGLATRVCALRIVTATGEVVACSPEANAALFEMARVSLGALGVLTGVTLALVPAYRLHERLLREDVETCLDRFDARARAHRHCEFFWLPGKDVAEVKLLEATQDDPDPLDDRPYERIDHSDRVLPSARELRFVEMEYALPAEAGLAAFRALRERMQSHHPDVRWPVEVRTVARDDIPLSPAFGRETVTLSVHQGHELPFEAFFADVEALLCDHGGRPHWGKWHRRRADTLRPLYPRWDDFLALRQAVDPDGRFLNEHLRGVFGIPEPTR